MTSLEANQLGSADRVAIAGHAAGRGPVEEAGAHPVLLAPIPVAACSCGPERRFGALPAILRVGRASGGGTSRGRRTTTWGCLARATYSVRSEDQGDRAVPIRALYLADRRVHAHRVAGPADRRELGRASWRIHDQPAGDYDRNAYPPSFCRMKLGSSSSLPAPESCRAKAVRAATTSVSEGWGAAALTAARARSVAVSNPVHVRIPWPAHARARAASNVRRKSASLGWYEWGDTGHCMYLSRRSCGILNGAGTTLPDPEDRYVVPAWMWTLQGSPTRSRITP